MLVNPPSTAVSVQHGLGVHADAASVCFGSTAFWESLNPPCPSLFSCLFCSVPPLSVDTPRRPDEYDLDCLLGRRLGKWNGDSLASLYLVRWSNYDETWDEWLGESNIRGSGGEKLVFEADRQIRRGEWVRSRQFSTGWLHPDIEMWHANNGHELV